MAIDAQIYPNNDAKILIEGLPTGLTVEWFIGADADATSPVGDCFGTCAEGTDGDDNVIYEDVLEGSDIADDLTDSVEYALIVKVGTDLRVYGLTTVMANRLANA